MTLKDAISKFGGEAKSRLSNPAASGNPEDQLRTPLDALVKDIAELTGLSRETIDLVGEMSLADLKTRPDYAVTYNKALVGFIEIKAPGKGSDPRQFGDPHDKEQWSKLQALPNLIYTDGNGFSLWRDGKLEGQIVHLEGDVRTVGKKLAAPGTPNLVALFADFFQWEPESPNSAERLAVVTARLCRLLRDEVTEQLKLGSASLTNLANDWRKLLFPSATNEAFADGYAQAVTFGLLMAREKNITLSSGLNQVAEELCQTNTLIGTALDVLTKNPKKQATLKTSLDTLIRVLDSVHWAEVSKGKPEAWLYFYEQFLSVYDNALRKKTGSYYTPPEVVRAMVRLVDEALRSGERFDLSKGLASPDVAIADPAMGTGTYMLGILNRIAEIAEDDQGPGGVPGLVEAAMRRLIGFEIQFGPFAVAQLRILAELRSILNNPEAKPEMRFFVTDTLGNPYADEEYIPDILMPLGESRKKANEIKRQEKIMVVIGNPPYKEKAMHLGGWIESGTQGNEVAAPLRQWMPPTDWNVGAHAKHLRNLYVYFWRWATWKVFGDGDPSWIEGREPDRRGIVSFITVAGFLNGPGFQKMRAELRAVADEIWVIDCSPEGHRPKVATRIFQGVQQPVCIVMALRKTDSGTSESARVRYCALPHGHRKDKFDALKAIKLNGGGWTDCPLDPRAPFFPGAEGAWAEFSGIGDMFVYNGSGVMPGRTWVIAPDRESLKLRWEALRFEGDSRKKESLFHPHLRKGKPGDKHVNKPLNQGLYGHEFRSGPVSSDKGAVIQPTRYGFHSFDRQWIVPDGRLINQPNPALWRNHSNEQVYLTALMDHSPRNGPALTFSANIPDLHHYNGRGGRVYPLWVDRQARKPNIKTALLKAVSGTLGIEVGAPDMMAYFAAVAAHPAYTSRFQSHLVQPGLRLPIAADKDLFSEAIEIGREVIWLHCFGERFAAGQPAGVPRMPEGERPFIPAKGEIPTENPGRFPDGIEYDASVRRLKIGAGFIDNVPPEVWKYEVSGMQVLDQWFSYRRFDRSRPLIGNRRPPSPLGNMQPNGWLADYTTELMEMLNVLGRLVALEPRQADLLARICDGSLIDAEDLHAKGAFDVAKGEGGSKSDEQQNDLL